MSESVRCPACRGAKKVPKLGGMIGECNTCTGKGTILAVDKPKPVIMESLPMTDAIIKATAECLPTSIDFNNGSIPLCAPSNTVIQHQADIQPLSKDNDVKIDPKKALYKRKKA